MVSSRPIASSVPVANDVLFSGLFEDVVPVDGCLAGFDVDVRDHEFRRIERKGSGPEELSRGAVQLENPARLSNHNSHVAFLPARDSRIDPFHRRRIWL